MRAGENDMPERQADLRKSMPGRTGAGASPRGRGAPARGSADDAPASPLDSVDDASDDSFPASDAPSWSGLHVGAPRTDR
jgi:hypothetical protein